MAVFVNLTVKKSRLFDLAALALKCLVMIKVLDDKRAAQILNDYFLHTTVSPCQT